MALRTYGDKPISFQIEENGEHYCIAAEVEKYLCFFRGSLYKRYPGMFRKSITNDERKKLFELGLSQHILASSVSLLRASEVKDIIEGNGDKYTTASIHSTKSPRKCKDKRSMASATISSHLYAPLSARQIKRKTLPHEKVSITLSRFDNRNPTANMKTVQQQETPMPWRMDEEIEAPRLGDISIWNSNAKRVSREDFIATEMEVEKTGATENSSQLEATHNQKCRLCLKNYDQFFELFQNDDILPLKIMAFASVKIEHGDGLPSVICDSCHQLLDSSYNFKCLVEKSDSALRETLLTRVVMNQNAVTESLAQSVTNNFVMQYESQRLPLRNINHPVSNDHSNRQDAVAREINEECISGNNHLPKKGSEDKNSDNELDNEETAEKDEDFNESEIIPSLNRSETFIIDLLEDGVSVSQSLQSMEYESEPIEQEELLLPEESNVSTEGDIHHEDETELRYTCYWCAKYFSDIAEHMNHVRNNHNSSNNANKDYIDNNHGRVETGEEVATLNKNIDSPNHEQIVQRKEYKSKCKVCTKQFTCQESFLSHIKTHPEYERSGTSDNHSERLEKTKESRKHQNNLSNSKMNESDYNSPLVGLQCIQCGIPFVTKESLKRHILTHYDLRFNCSICAKEFQYLDVLKDHQRSQHKGEILGTSGDKDYDTVDERRKETECRPHKSAMCPKVPTLDH